jgi:hypothetical protein
MPPGAVRVPDTSHRPGEDWSRTNPGPRRRQRQRDAARTDRSRPPVLHNRGTHYHQVRTWKRRRLPDKVDTSFPIQDSGRRHCCTCRYTGLCRPRGSDRSLMRTDMPSPTGRGRPGPTVAHAKNATVRAGVHDVGGLGLRPRGADRAEPRGLLSLSLDDPKSPPTALPVLSLRACPHPRAGTSRRSPRPGPRTACSWR